MKLEKKREDNKISFHLTTFFQSCYLRNIFLLLYIYESFYSTLYTCIDVHIYIDTQRHEKIAHTYRFQSMSVGQGRQCIVFFFNEMCVRYAVMMTFYFMRNLINDINLLNENLFYILCSSFYISFMMHHVCIALF